MRKQTVGYIVECRNHHAMELDDRDGQLYFGSIVTLFPDRRTAKRAIDATIAPRLTFEKEFGKLSITRLVAAQAARAILD